MLFPAAVEQVCVPRPPFLRGLVMRLGTVVSGSSGLTQTNSMKATFTYKLGTHGEGPDWFVYTVNFRLVQKFRVFRG